MKNLLQPIEEPLPPKIAEILANYPQQDGYLLTLFRTFANSERFLTKGVPNLLDKESPVPLRVREIVILRVTANNFCEYEWGVHAAIFAKAAKLTEAQLADTLSDEPSAEQWSPQEAALIRCVDQLCASGNLDEESLGDFQKRWSAEQQLEIFALCGAYHTVSFVANAARLRPESFARRFPVGAR